MLQGVVDFELISHYSYHGMRTFLCYEIILISKTMIHKKNQRRVYFNVN